MPPIPFLPQVYLNTCKASTPQQKIHLAVQLTVQYFNDVSRNPGYCVDYNLHPNNMYTFVLQDILSTERIYFVYRIRNTAKICVRVHTLFKKKLRELQQRITDAELTE